MVQVAYRNRELTSYPKINHVFVSSKAVFTAGALSSQYQAAITLCKQSYVDTQNTIKIYNIEINPFAINLDVSGCSGANNKGKKSPPAVPFFSTFDSVVRYFRFR